MELQANNKITLRPMDEDNAAALFPLFKADLKELSRWFPFGEDYILEYDLSYVDEKEPPFEETFVIYCQGQPCGRVGLYDYDDKHKEIFLYYWVATPFRRKHIALCAVNTVLDYLRTLGIRRALFDVKKDNLSSIGLLSQLSGATVKEEDEKCRVYAASFLPFKTFGTKENVQYYDREGAYVIPIKDNKVCLVKTPKGYFLIGGGMNDGESETACLSRECLEETGCQLVIGKKIASAETFCTHPKRQYFHPIQHYYCGELLDKAQEPVERDHQIEWVDIGDIGARMFAPMQEWAIRIAGDETAK